MNTRNRSLFLSIAIAVLTVPILNATPAPGAYWKWRGEIDQVLVNQTFRADDYRGIEMAALDVSDAKVPVRGGESQSAVLDFLPSLKPAFMSGLQKTLQRDAPDSKTGGDLLLVRMRVTKADPGTRIPQFWNMKDSAARLAVTGEVIDPATNQTLLAFRQERWVGMMETGQSSEELLKRVAQMIGADLARLISSS